MKICIDAGHYGKYNQSPCNTKYYESEMTWKLQNFLKTELEKRKNEVITTREKQNVDLALEARGKKSRGCDLFLSLHSNACDNPSSDYSMTCCLIDDKNTDIDDISRTLGKILADKVSYIMTGKNKGKVYCRKGSGGTDYYGVLRGAKSVGTPAILLEHGFHTNYQNTEFLLDDENLKKLAAAEAEIIADYFKVSISSADTVSAFKVKILDNELNIRTDAGINNKIVGVIKDNGVYTIVDTKEINGVLWGKLKSGVGWISLHKNCVKRV